MNLERFVQKSRTPMTPGQVSQALQKEEIDTVPLEGGGFIGVSYPSEDEVLVQYLHCENQGKEMMDALVKMFAGKRIYFLTFRNPQAWYRGSGGRCQFRGYLMEVCDGNGRDS